MLYTCKSSGSAGLTQVSPGGERRTGEEYIGTYPGVGDNPAKVGLIPHMLYGGKRGTCKGLALAEWPISD